MNLNLVLLVVAFVVLLIALVRAQSAHRQLIEANKRLRRALDRSMTVLDEVLAHAGAELDPTASQGVLNDAHGPLRDPALSQQSLTRGKQAEGET